MSLTWSIDEDFLGEEQLVIRVDFPHTVQSVSLERFRGNDHLKLSSFQCFKKKSESGKEKRFEYEIWLKPDEICILRDFLNKFIGEQVDQND